MKRTAALFMITGKYKDYTFFVENSVNSFKKWHPDIDVVIADDTWLSKCKSPEPLMNKLEVVQITFEELGYEKVILIDADTITCARFDELLDDDETPVLATLDFPMDPAGYPFPVNKYMLPHNGMECKNVNSGIVCYNTPQAIRDVIKIAETVDGLRMDQYAIQYYADTNPHLVKIVDFPYTFSTFVYNTRGHGTIGTECIRDGKLYFGFDGPLIAEIAPTRLYRPFGNKLYNHMGKHVKLFHFTTRNPEIKNWFSDDTVEFFKKYCDCDWNLSL